MLTEFLTAAVNSVMFTEKANVLIFCLYNYKFPYINFFF